MFESSFERGAGAYAWPPIVPPIPDVLVDHRVRPLSVILVRDVLQVDVTLRDAVGGDN